MYSSRPVIHLILLRKLLTSKTLKVLFRINLSRRYVVHICGIEQKNVDIDVNAVFISECM